MPDTDRLLRLLEEIDRGDRLTQRDIATRLSISLGLTNELLHRSIGQGLVQGAGSQHYVLTPDGQSEKCRLTYHRLKNTIGWYKTTRERIKDNLHRLAQESAQRIVFYGAGDVAEVAYGALDGLPLELVAIVDDFCAGESFYPLTISPVNELLRLQYERIVVTTFRSTAAICAHVSSLGISESRLFFFR